jgi:hypothetical protein
VTTQMYRDSTLPKCDLSANGISTCIVTSSQNSNLRGNCSATINVRGVNTTYSLNNVALNSS